MNTRPHRLPLGIVAAFALSLTPALASAQSLITWTVKDIVDKNDVSTKGALCFAVNFGPEVCERVVNGVHFQADRAHWTKKRLVENGPIVNGQMYWPDIRAGGFALKGAPSLYNRAAPNIGPRHTTDANYDELLRHGRHMSPGDQSVVCTLEGLVAGNSYEIQIWYGNQSRPTRITEWDNGQGGREGKGGIFMTPSGPYFGQVATGVFVADKSGKQSFINFQQKADATKTPPLKETWGACSAMQLRDLTPRPLRARATYYGVGTPGTDTQPNLGGTKCSPGIAFEGHPIISNLVKLTAENSSGTNSAAIVAFGQTPLSVPIFQGTLLVTPTITFGMLMPKPASPFVHDHELQIPFSIPNAPGALYVQVVQLDPGAPGGFSFTAGMKIEIGFGF